MAESLGSDFEVALGSLCEESPGTRPWAPGSSLGLSFIICKMQRSERTLTQTKAVMLLGEPM